MSTISPSLSLDLRLRFLETLLKSTSNLNQTSITSQLNLFQSEFDVLLNDSTLKRFISNYDLNEPLLRLPPLPSSSSHSSSSSESNLNPLEKLVLILESELEIRTIEKELREIEVLDERGIVGSGRLGEHEELKEELKGLKESSLPELNTKYNDLEKKTEVVLGSYNQYINTLSQVFISWNEIITSAEDEVTRREKERDRVEDIS